MEKKYTTSELPCLTHRCNQSILWFMISQNSLSFKHKKADKHLRIWG